MNLRLSFFDAFQRRFLWKFPVILRYFIVNFLCLPDILLNKSIINLKQRQVFNGEEVDLGDENNFIDTGYEIVDITNYEEVWASKTPW